YDKDAKDSLIDHIYDRDGRPRMHHVEEITLDTEFEHHIVTLNNNDKMRLADVKVNKFRVVPLGGNQVALTFRVQAHPTPEQVAQLYGWQKKVVTIDIEPGDAPIADDSDAEEDAA